MEINNTSFTSANVFASPPAFYRRVLFFSMEPLSMTTALEQKKNKTEEEDSLHVSTQHKGRCLFCLFVPSILPPLSTSMTKHPQGSGSFFHLSHCRFSALVETHGDLCLSLSVAPRVVFLTCQMVLFLFLFLFLFLCGQTSLLFKKSKNRRLGVFSPCPTPPHNRTGKGS
ncbi:hypothetical protein BDF14DRAFT_1853269 [Spinellus fusiger]|nr:hypothetical protein BDF14DRAFT_1853269 [Spinellus fusiger]